MSLFGDLFKEEKPKRKHITKGDKVKILARQKDRCAKCGKKFGPRSVIHLDHKNPLAHGGSDTLRNLQALCPNCHAKKTQTDRTKIAKKKRRKKENDPFRLENILAPPKKRRGRKPKSIWDI